MGEVGRIDLKLDRKVFQVVLATFSFMRDTSDPTVLDFASMFISPRDIADMVDKLRSSDSGGDPVTISMGFDDWTVFTGLLLQTSAKIPQTEPDAYEILEALSQECSRLDDSGEAPQGPEPRSWQLLSEAEKALVAVRIDAQDSFNNYGAHAGTIMQVGLSFYPGAMLLRVTSRSPAVGSRYFIKHDEELIPLHRVGDVQTFCDAHFGAHVTAGSALDYFRFAYFFFEQGLRMSLVECPQDLRIDPAAYHLGQRKASAAFIKPPEIQMDETGLTVTACTFAEPEFRLTRDTYRLTPGQRLQLLKREDSGIDLGRPFHDHQLKIGRPDLSL